MLARPKIPNNVLPCGIFVGTNKYATQKGMVFGGGRHVSGVTNAPSKRSQSFLSILARGSKAKDDTEVSDREKRVSLRRRASSTGPSRDVDYTRYGGYLPSLENSKLSAYMSKQDAEGDQKDRQVEVKRHTKMHRSLAVKASDLTTSSEMKPCQYCCGEGWLTEKGFVCPSTTKLAQQESAVTKQSSAVTQQGVIEIRKPQTIYLKSSAELFREARDETEGRRKLVFTLGTQRGGGEWNLGGQGHYSYIESIAPLKEMAMAEARSRDYQAKGGRTRSALVQLYSSKVDVDTSKGIENWFKRFKIVSKGEGTPIELSVRRMSPIEIETMA